MNMKRLTVGVAIVGMSAGIAVCAQEDYKDPQKFVERYVREDIEREYPGHVYNPILQYSGFELVNARSEMRETLSGAYSRIVCQFRVVPERGVEYYCRDNVYRWLNPEWFGRLSKDAERVGLTEERVNGLHDGIGAFFEHRPLLVKKTEIDADDLIYVYRTRNEDGVFVPMRVAAANCIFRYEGVGAWYNTNELFSARTAKALGALESESAEGRAAYAAYSNKCETIRAGIKAVNEAMTAFNSVTNVLWGRPSFAQTRRGELAKERVAPLKEELAALEKTLNEQVAAGKKKSHDIRFRASSAAREKQKLEKNLARLRASRKNTEKRIAEATQATGRKARAAQRQLPKLNDNLADVVKKLEEGDARLQELAAQQAELKDEKQSSAAENEKAQAETTARIAEVKGRIENQVRSVDAQVSVDVQNRFEQLSKEIQAQMEALEGMLFAR